MNQAAKTADKNKAAEKPAEAAPVAAAAPAAAASAEPAPVPPSNPSAEPAPVPADWHTAPPPPAGKETPAAEPSPSPPPEPVPFATPVVEEKPPAPPPKEEAAPPPAPPPAPPQPCPICGTLRKGTQSYCDDCGWMFPPGAPAAAGPQPAAADGVAAPNPGTRLKERFEVGGLHSERGEVSRFRGLDHESGTPKPVFILRMAVPAPAEVVLEEETPVAAVGDDTDEIDILPSFEEPMVAAAAVVGPDWPSLAWEKALLEKADSPALPKLIDSFVEGGFEYLVEEAPEGRSIWDAWDDPEATAKDRYGLLKKLAQTVTDIHQGGAIFEGLRPDLIVMSEQNEPRIADLADLLPVPLPPDVQIRCSLYTPPELVLNAAQADARADLYSFGAMLYALEYLHHELTESDFERQFSPKLITDRFPDVHPGFFRLLSKTFVRDVNTRFPTDEAGKEDATGFTELMRTLDVCGRSFDNVRFDVAAWTTTGMVRTGNEDAFALLHAVESRQDELSEYALLLLADGMGGYEAGEVAAAMAIQSLRKYLLGQKMFAALAGDVPPPEDVFNVEGCKQILLAALKHANREVYTASRTPGVGKRGMGCTAEAVYVDPYNIVVGHVGDSRTYHLAQGRLVQLTRDQTFVNRMVELGALTPEEAEDHPRKNELQQAIGGQPDVQPGLYHGKLKRGDWILVCSDGLTNHIPPEDLQKMLLREATSAEEAARRLLNMVNLRGATDNATVVIIRAC
jgi:protein phosphatase